LSYLLEKFGYALKGIFSNPGAKPKLVILALTSSLIALSELGIAKIFTDIVVNLDELQKYPFLEIGIFVALSVMARLAHFFQRTKRVVYLDRIVENSKVKNPRNSWNLSLAIEVTNILGYALQIIVISIFLLYLNVILGSLTIVGILLTLTIFNKIALGQERFQREVFQAKYLRVEISSGKKGLGRVKGGEAGTFIAALVAIGSMIFLIYLHHLGRISTADSIVTFFALRMLSTNLSSLSTGLMRFVRALVNSSISTVAVTSNSLEDESL
jgi:hypothetical protein